MKEFLLSDESVNSYGFIVVTGGINIAGFSKNPVMFFNHDREKGVIGKWENLYKGENKLYGTPCFDENDELGNKVSGKVKDGFIRAASIGINNATWGDVDEVPAVLTCDLVECSICDIPSNKNALVLYDGDKPVTEKEEIFKLYKLNLKNMNNDLKPVTDALGLSEATSVNGIVKAINMAIIQNNPKDKIELAVKSGIIEDYERDELIKLASSNRTAFNSYLEKRTNKVMEERKVKGLELTVQTFRSGAINSDANGVVKEFWLRNFCADFETTGIALKAIPIPVPVCHQLRMLQTGTEDDRSTWTLNDYRKKAPMELKNNPDLYKRLIEKEQN